jgi:hypothetical protein
MVGAEECLFDRDGPPVELLGLLGITTRVANRTEVVEIDGDFVVIRAVGTLEHGQGMTDKCLGLFALALTVQNCGQGRGIGCDVRVRGPECPMLSVASTLSRVISAGPSLG